jgi:hypothetical protein
VAGERLRAVGLGSRCWPRGNSPADACNCRLKDIIQQKGSNLCVVLGEFAQRPRAGRNSFVLIRVGWHDRFRTFGRFGKGCSRECR